MPDSIVVLVLVAGILAIGVWAKSRSRPPRLMIRSRKRSRSAMTRASSSSCDSICLFFAATSSFSRRLITPISAPMMVPTVTASPVMDLMTEMPAASSALPVPATAGRREGSGTVGRGVGVTTDGCERRDRHRYDYRSRRLEPRLDQRLFG